MDVPAGFWWEGGSRRGSEFISGPVCAEINETAFLLSAVSAKLIRYAGVIDRCGAAAARPRDHAR